MPVKVVDASVVAAIVFGEPEAERAAALIDNAELVAPPLLELDIDYVDVDHEAVLDLAVEKGVTDYDASYLWLSRKLKAPLVTLDERLSAIPRGAV
jgi:predicted nucleic acid-binding protein